MVASAVPVPRPRNTLNYKDLWGGLLKSCATVGDSQFAVCIGWEVIFPRSCLADRFPSNARVTAHDPIAWTGPAPRRRPWLSFLRTPRFWANTSDRSPEPKSVGPE